MSMAKLVEWSDAADGRFFDLTYHGDKRFTLALFLGDRDAHPDVRHGPRAVEIKGTVIPDLLAKAVTEIGRITNA